MDLIYIICEIYPKIGCYRLEFHRRGAHMNFFQVTIPSYFKIYILANSSLRMTLALKGLKKKYVNSLQMSESIRP